MERLPQRRGEADEGKTGKIEIRFCKGCGARARNRGWRSAGPTHTQSERERDSEGEVKERKWRERKS